MMHWFLLSVAVLSSTVFAQDSLERVILKNGEEVRGTLISFESGRLGVRIKEGKTRHILIEDLHRVTLEEEAPPSGVRAPFVRLQRGGVIGGSVRSIVGNHIFVESCFGEVKLFRSEIRDIVLLDLKAPIPRWEEEGKNAVVTVAKRGDTVQTAVVLGDAVEMNAERLILQRGEQKESIERSAMALIHFAPLGKPLDAPPGFYLKIVLQNGDRFPGVLSGVEGERIRFFSHLFGEIAIPRKAIHALHVVQGLRLQSGNWLVCDQGSVREFDRRGGEIWQYNVNLSFPASASRLENGNTLICNANYGQIIEVQPNKEVVWKFEGLQQPWDAHRLESGNLLVAEFGGRRLVELDRRQAVVWEKRVPYNPMGVERLENGGTLASANYQAFIYDKDGNTVWTAAIPQVRPWRIRALENGRFLVVDMNQSRVLEVDSKNTVLWKVEGLSRPADAVRLEDGYTLVVEQGKNRVVEVDPTGGAVTPLCENLDVPSRISVY